LFLSSRGKRVSPEDVQHNIDEARSWAERVQSGTFIPPDTPIIMRSGELPILHNPSELIEAKATRFYAGGGTRINGIYIGGGASRPVDALSKIDSGTLTLTTQRLVFDGEMQSRSVELKNLVSLKWYADAIEIASSKRSKSQVYAVANPILWQAIIKSVISGGLTVVKQKVEATKPLTSDSVESKPEVINLETDDSRRDGGNAA